MASQMKRQAQHFSRRTKTMEMRMAPKNAAISHLQF